MKLYQILTAVALLAATSCSKESILQDEENKTASLGGLRTPYRISIDSAYAYHGDSLYRSMANEYYNSTTVNNGRSIQKASSEKKMSVGVNSMTPEDEAFFSKKHTVTSTEATIYHGRNYIYPGAIIEGNTISKANYLPIYVQDRNPITLSMTVKHSPPKPTSRTIANPSNSKIDDYVKEMAYGADFSQNERFMFQYRRFTFYDELKQAFGTDIDTRKLFSSRSESSNTESHKILESTGMYVKFFQASFTVHMDIAPLAQSPIQGTSGEPPVYVSSVTYGRMGIIVLETDKEYQFAETCIKKEFDRIFYNRTETLTEEEQKFFEETQFKVLIVGGDSDYTVQTFKGYSHFLNLIYNSTFTGTSYGVPIACSFSDANTHQLIETEFENTTYIEPLYVSLSRENIINNYDPSGQFYHNSAKLYLNFYKDREKTKTANPYTDIVFEVMKYENNCDQEAIYPNGWGPPMIDMNCTDNDELMKIRNIGLTNRIFLGNEISSYESSGPMPTPKDPPMLWNAREYRKTFTLSQSPFFITIY